jgi:hypothetical protein
MPVVSVLFSDERSLVQERARNALGNDAKRYRVQVSRLGEFCELEAFVRIFDVEFRELIQRRPDVAPQIDEGLFFQLARMVTLSDLRPYGTHQADQQAPQVKHQYRFRQVGSRLHFTTQPALAQSLGVSVAKLRKELSIYRDVLLITDHGHRWIELNPRVIWRGSLEHRDAYLRSFPDKFGDTIFTGSVISEGVIVLAAQ